MADAPLIRVPVVYASAPENILPRFVKLATVVTVRPQREWATSVVVSTLCAHASVGFLGTERPGDAWLEPTPNEGAQAIDGRSAGLGLALAAIGAFEGLSARAAVVATGELRAESWESHGDTASVRVHRVDRLREKLERACEVLAQEGGPALVLYPADLTDAERAAIRRLAETHRQVRLLAVDTLADAVRHVFAVHCEWPFKTPRAYLAHNRYDDAKAADLFTRCRALRAVAAQLPAAAPRRWHLHLEAADFAAFALRKLGNASVARWGDDEDTCDAATARSAVDADVALLESQHRAGAADEFIAGLRNLRATDAFRTLRFSQAIRIATDALALPGVQVNRRAVGGEYRKLLGTRAQFQWRQGLRSLVLDQRDEAEWCLTEAKRDAQEAYEAADSHEVAEQNDRARVRIYRAAANLAWELAGFRNEAEPAAEVQELRELLGPLAEANADGTGTPPQDPRWALEFCYSRWLCRGEPEAVVRHVQIAWTLPHGRGDGLGETTVWSTLHAQGKPMLRCDMPLVARALEAAVCVGDDDLANRLRSLLGAASWSRELLSLDAHLLLYPDHDLPADSYGAAIQELRAAQWEGDLLPSAARGSAWVAVRLEAMRNSDRDRLAADRARSELMLWTGRFAARVPG